MAYRIAFLGLLLGALSACTITIQQPPPQPANGYYYASVPVAAGSPVPIAGQPYRVYRVYERPARSPAHYVAAPVSRTPAAAPGPTRSAVRPSLVVRPPNGAQAPRPVAFPAPGPTPVAAQPPLASPVRSTPAPVAVTPAPRAVPPAATGPLAPPVRRPVAVGNEKADPRVRSSESTVK